MTTTLTSKSGKTSCTLLCTMQILAIFSSELTCQNTIFHNNWKHISLQYETSANTIILVYKYRTFNPTLQTHTKKLYWKTELILVVIFSCYTAITHYTHVLQLVQEAPLSPRDCAMCRVNWNLANCHATVQKLLIRQVLTKSMVRSWRFSRRQCVIHNVHSTMTRPSRLPLSQVS